jgi:competence protein ComEC
VKLEEQLIAKRNSYKTKASAIATVDSFGVLHPAEGNLIVYVAKQDSLQLSYGDLVVVPFGFIREVSGPQNPDEFDYKRYLAFHGIHDQVYLRASEVQKLPVNKGSALRKWVYGVQAYFKSVLSRCIASSNETGVAEALLYGFDDDIDAETVQAYSNTGTLHVLAVSGMHVGIIFMILDIILKPLDRNKRLKLMKHVVILGALWLYSLLCGLSPSILRATVMFSFMIVASILNIRSSVYNTLAASALVLLCADSNMLANVGFQLSYLAVLGIVFFQSYFYNWYHPTNPLVDEIWKITAVSLAAQLTTFPVGLLYFHQFPNCFLFSNLIIIPLTTLILYMAMVLLVVAKLSWVSWLLGQALYYVIGFTNGMVMFVERIPFAYVNGIHISIAQSILLYGMVGLASAYFLLRRLVYLKLCLVISTVFMVLNGWSVVENYTQNRLMIYAVRNNSVIQCIRGNQSLMMGDSALLADADKMKFHLQQHQWRRGIQQTEKVFLTTEWKRMTVNQYYVVLISGEGQPTFTEERCSLLVITRPIAESQLQGIPLPSRVIITAAVKPREAHRLSDYFKPKNIPVQYVGETGAIEVSLPN